MPKSRMTIVAVKGLLLRQGRALILRRSHTDKTAPGQWEFPGGKLEFGESPTQTLLRESQEETGLTVTPGPVIYTSSSTPSPTRQILIICFLAQAPSGSVTLSFEHSEYLWATQSQMESHLMPGILRNLENNNVFGRSDVFIEP